MPNPFGWGQDEPQIKPKDQGGDTIATFCQKVYNLFDNLFNTLNSYPWSTATQSDAGYMSAADKVKCDSALTGTTTYTSAYLGGNYYLTKHSNGLMILAGNAKIATTSAYGGVNYTFPEAFFQVPGFTVTSKNYYNFYVPGLSTTTLSLGFRNLDGSYPALGTEIEFYFIVVGRWS